MIKKRSSRSTKTASAPAFLSSQVKSSRYFWIDVEGKEQAGFQVVSGGFETCRPDYRIERDDFPCHVFELVVDGLGQLRLGNRDHSLKRGVAFLYGPGTPHRITTDPGRPLEKFFVGLRGRAMRKFLDDLKLESGSVLQISDIGPVVSAFDELITRGARDSHLTKQLCEALVRQILITTVEDGLEASASGTQAFATYERVRDHIALHYLETDSVESIASACSLDAAYLSRLFSRFQSESPHRYLTRLRMEHAARLLLDSDATVREVAEQVGFTDPFRFSRVFKSVHRLPPSHFRQGLQPRPSHS